MTRYSERSIAATLGVRVELLREVSAQAADYYRRFPIRRGTKVREINRAVGVLQFIQKRIKIRLLVGFPFPEAIHGCVTGRSPFTNAREHRNQPCVASLDLRAFYPSVTCRMVYQAWSQTFGFGHPIASLLTKLTTHKGHLPQGTATSGYLANIVLLPVVSQIRAVAEQMGCRVTFYVDDITISGGRAREVLGPVIEIVHGLGLSVRHGKTRVMGRGRRQLVTGYTVNNPDGPSVPLVKRAVVREIIHELHVRQSLGEDVARFGKSMSGRIAHIRFTNPGSAARLQRLLDLTTRCRGGQ